MDWKSLLYISGVWVTVPSCAWISIVRSIDWLQARWQKKLCWTIKLAEEEMMKGTKCYGKRWKNDGSRAESRKNAFPEWDECRERERERYSLSSGDGSRRRGIPGSQSLTQTTKLWKRCELLMHDTDRSPHPASSTDSCKFRSSAFPASLDYQPVQFSNVAPAKDVLIPPDT